MSLIPRILRASFIGIARISELEVFLVSPACPDVPVVSVVPARGRGGLALCHSGIPAIRTAVTATWINPTMR